MVTDLQDNAVPSARVTVGGAEDVGTPPPAVRRNGAPDAAGSFRWTGFRSGRYTVQVRKGGFKDVRLDLRGGEDRMRIATTPNAAPH